MHQLIDSAITPISKRACSKCDIIAVCFLCLLMLWPGNLIAAVQIESESTDSVLDVKVLLPMGEATMKLPADSLTDGIASSSLLTDDIVTPSLLPDEAEIVSEFGKKREFNPSPERAAWLAALFPGLGQIYNRRYWKLPIIVAGFMGLGYATSWNNNQLRDYTTAFRDITDNDPSTDSYMNFFPPTTSESDLDKTWLTNTLRSRKNFYRRNRDLCIICMVGLYLLCMADAYIDASMTHFDISENLSFDIQPALFITPTDKKPAFGLNWAFNF